MREMVPGGDENDHDDVDHHLAGVQVCGGLAGAAVRAEGLGSSHQLQGSKSETFAMLGAVNIVHHSSHFLMQVWVSKCHARIACIAMV